MDFEGDISFLDLVGDDSFVTLRVLVSFNSPLTFLEATSVPSLLLPLVDRTYLCFSSTRGVFSLDPDDFAFSLSGFDLSDFGGDGEDFSPLDFIALAGDNLA